MRQTILETVEDFEWLKDVHGIAVGDYACAILHGNEDSPNKIELYAVDNYKCRPTVYEPDANGKMVLKSYGRKPKARVVKRPTDMEMFGRNIG